MCPVGGAAVEEEARLATEASEQAVPRVDVALFQDSGVVEIEDPAE